MKIGELSRQTGCNVQTIRYYERAGLLPVLARSEGNYRLYGKEHVSRLSFIRHCRSLDMALDEIRTLLTVRDEPTRSCQEVNDMLDEHLIHVRSRIEELKSLEKQLRAVRSMCGKAHTAKDCAILNELGGESALSPDKPRQTAVHHFRAKQ